MTMANGYQCDRENAAQPPAMVAKIQLLSCVYFYVVVCRMCLSVTEQTRYCASSSGSGAEHRATI